MSQQTHEPIHFGSVDKGQVERLRALSSEILKSSSRGISRIEFSREVAELLMAAAKCDAVELETVENGKWLRCVARQEPDQDLDVQVSTLGFAEREAAAGVPSGDSDLRKMCHAAVHGQLVSPPPFLTSYGSYWFAGGMEFQTSFQSDEQGQHIPIPEDAAGYHSLALIPFVIDDEKTGFLYLKSRRRDYFWRNAVEYFENLAQTIGVAVTFRRLQEALRERVKELSCLYQIAQLAEQSELEVEDLLKRIVEILPLSWLHRDVAVAEITLDGRSYTASKLENIRHKQTSRIMIGNTVRGAVAVAYTGDVPDLGNGPFLAEEQKLIDAVAGEVARIVDRKEAEAEQRLLEEQLRHADRLSTIGQLAAGVAHELNEPLGSILGFAQLLGRAPDLPESAMRDVEKIVTASLYARQIIRNLMIFSRQVPTQRIALNLNQIVEEALLFFEARCAKRGIEVVHSFSEHLPDVIGDPAQLKQSVVNLAVNAIQAMPAGGKLSITTSSQDETVSFIIEDTGTGMNEEEVEKAFLPFFTTKDVGEGTGLGLSVVHGIVTSHGGYITAESELGRGSKFEIHLPQAGVSIRPEAGDGNTGE